MKLIILTLLGSSSDRLISRLSMKRRIKSPSPRCLFYAAIGGITYWTADGLLVLLSTVMPVRIWIIVKSGMLPIVAICMFGIIVRVHAIGKEEVFGVAVRMVLGIWILSPVYMFIASMFSENGSMGIMDMGWLLAAFPMTAIIASTYSGGLLGLFFSSLGMPVAAVVLARKSKGPQ